MTLIDRTAELGILESALAEAWSGHARVVSVEGAVGCGKSALMDALAERAVADGALVLRASCAELERIVPLGVLRQLARGLPGGATWGVPGAADAWEGPPRVEEMAEFYAALCTAGGAAPVVCCIDDLHHADHASLQYLRYLARHAHAVRLLLVVAGSPHHHTEDPAFGTELLRRQDLLRIRLDRLSLGEVTEVLDALPVTGRPHAVAADLHLVSGGNPLLLRALLAEYRGAQADAVTPHTPAAGGAFAQAVQTCLHRSGPTAALFAAALAVLAEESTPERAGRLIGFTTSDATRCMSALNAAGILAGHRFRHRVAETAVLDGLKPGRQADLHRRAAQLLHDSGEPTTVVARHLLDSGGSDLPWPQAPWASSALCALAEELLLEDRAKDAAEALELAVRACPSEQRRADIAVRLAAITWRFNPVAAERLLRGPLHAVRSGRAAPGQLGPLTQLLMTQGRIVEAGEIIARAGERAPRRELPAQGPATGQAPLSVWAVPDAVDDAAADEAERCLRAAVLTATNLQLITRAVRTLALSTRPGRACAWGQRLREESLRRNAPGWAAVFATLQAEALLRAGDLREAEQQALAGLACLPETHGGFFSCAPLAVLIRARTEMGKHAAVAQQLDRPSPEGLSSSVHALGYLRARGQHYLMTHQLPAALTDFYEAGRLMKQWRMDRPLAFPWRTDAAQALIRLGETQGAERLVLQQLSGPDGAHPWVRGISLRVQASLRGPQQRPAVLDRAIEELRRSGDRVELARALAEMGQSLLAVGQNSRARTMTRRAWNLAHACGAEELREETFPGLASQPVLRNRLVRPPVSTPVDCKLSESERRVATLAAQGFTNREIAAQLYVTVSTVEQHLTRVYRKLSVTRRQDLPLELQLGSVEV